MRNVVRRDWEHNQDLISEAFFTYITKHKKMPTMAKLTEITGLAMKTIQRHLQEPTFKKNTEKLRAIQDKMLITFTGKVAKSSDNKMWELYFKLTETEFVDKVDVTTKGKELPAAGVTVTLNID